MSKRNFWIFQANPDRFNASGWWRYMNLADQWRIHKSHRDNIREMGVNAIWVAMVGEDDIWSVETQHHEKIASNDALHATFLREKFDSWSVFQHKNQINKNDAVAIWVAGKDDVAGVYAIVDVVSDPYNTPFPTEGNIAYWIRQKDREELPKSPWLRVSIRYLRLSDPPWRPLISRSSILDDEKLQDLVILRFYEATNLGPIPLEEWERIIELIELRSRA